MGFMSKDEALLAQIQHEVEAISTVEQLLEYLRTFKSAVVGEVINSAFAFFSHDCRTPDGGLDRKAVKERQRLGMRQRITPESEITPELCSALKLWLIGPGRNLGTGFLENQLSVSQGVALPRYVAFDLLTLLQQKFKR